LPPAIVTQSDEGALEAAREILAGPQGSFRIQQFCQRHDFHVLCQRAAFLAWVPSNATIRLRLRATCTIFKSVVRSIMLNVLTMKYPQSMPEVHDDTYAAKRSRRRLSAVQAFRDGVAFANTYLLL